MRAVVFDNGLKLDKNYAKPSPQKGEALIKVNTIGICNTDYEITKGYMGYKGVLAEHKASGQKLAVLNPSKSTLLTKKDFADGSIKKKLDGLNEKLAYQYIRLENFEITKQGKFHSMGQTIPYVKYKADVTNLPMKHIEGIIGVAEDKEQHSKILLSAAEGGKYSQIITEQFFSKVK